MNASDRMKQFFDQTNFVIRSSEASFVNLLSSLAPWLAPLAPAYMSLQHMQTYLNFPPLVSWAVAGTVEIMGLSTISTAIAFWSHNRRYKKEYKKAPVWIAVLAFCTYITIILSVNVLLEWSNTKETLIWARALLTMMSVPAAVTLAVRTQHQELLMEIAGAKNNRPATRDELKQEILQLGVQEQENLQKPADWRRLSLQDQVKIQDMSARQIMETYNISERAAHYWKSRSKGNGNGYSSG